MPGETPKAAPISLHRKQRVSGSLHRGAKEKDQRKRDLSDGNAVGEVMRSVSGELRNLATDEA
jgi:hypothetical protein